MARVKSNIYVKCIICGSNKNEFICYSRNYRVEKLKTPIRICRECGFVFVNPRWTKEDYNKIMDEWYPFKFNYSSTQKIELSNHTNDNARFAKWIRMYNRIKEYYPKGIESVLDVGAGQGWCIEFLKRKFPSINAYAIERWPQCQKNIIDRYGGTIIGEDVSEEWNSEYKNRFDLIVFRHTLEHLLDPLAAIEKIRYCLNDNGYAYIVVPSIREINTEKNLFHGYFRPIHLSYFCKETLESLTNRMGLKPHVIKEKNEGEVWGLFKKSDKEFTKPNVYFETLDRIKRISRKQKLKSIYTSLRIRAYHLSLKVGLMERSSS